MASLRFDWGHDDSVNPDISYRLYENNEQIVKNIAVLSFTLLMNNHTQGEFTYHVTAYDNKTQLESVPSPTVTVNFTQPAPVSNFGVGWIG